MGTEWEQATTSYIYSVGPSLPRLDIVCCFLLWSTTNVSFATIAIVSDMAPGVSHAEDYAIAREEAPEIPYVNWRKDPGLRKLYLYAVVICIASATTGYDG